MLAKPTAADLETVAELLEPGFVEARLHIDERENPQVRIEPREFVLLRHVDPLGDCRPAFFLRRLRQVRVAFVESVPKGIRHGDEPNVVFGGKSLKSGARAPAAASNKTNPDRVVIEGSRRGSGSRNTGSEETAGNGGAGPEEFATIDV